MQPAAKHATRAAIFVILVLVVTPSLLVAETHAPPPAETAAQAERPAPPAPPVPAAPAVPAAAPGGQPANEEDVPEDLPFPRKKDDKVAIGTDVEIRAGEEYPAGVVCIGGTVKLAGAVQRDVVVIGGTIEMTGKAGGNVVGVGSKMILKDGARIGGDLVNVFGSLSKSDVEVGGQVVNVGFGGWLARLPGRFGVFGFLFFWIKFLKLVLVFVGLLILAAIFPDRIRMISHESPTKPFMAFLAGLGVYIALVVTMILLCITLIGIPAAILLYFVFVVLKWLGLAGLFHAVGSRIGRGVNREMSLLGGILLGLLPFALLYFLPFCIGGFIWFVMEVIAVGYVIMTRAGGRPSTAPAPQPAVQP